jgi:hypothetical protein
MTKWRLISFLIVGLFADKAFADCLPAPDTPAAIIEHFQKFNKPLPEQFCAKRTVPHESSQAEEAPDQAGEVDDGPADRPFAQYEGDPGAGYEARAAMRAIKGAVTTVNPSGITRVTQTASTRLTKAALMRVTKVESGAQREVMRRA